MAHQAHMLSLAEEAALLHEGLHRRFVTPAEVVAWADRRIAELPDPPAPLLDASLAARDRPEELAVLLEPLAAHTDCRQNAPALLALMHRALSISPDRADAVAAALWDWSLDQRAPSMVRELESYSFELEDADCSAYGVRDEIVNELAARLSVYAAAPTVAI